MKRILLLAGLAIVIDSGCAVLFLPKNQKVTVATNNKESKIFVDKELQGKGTANFKTKKEGMKQVVIQTSGYKDNYCVLLNNKREPGFWACVGFDAIFVPAIYGYAAMLFDFKTPKGHAYNKETRFSVTGKIKDKTSDYKYIDIDKIGLQIDNPDKDVVLYRVIVPKGNSKKIEKLMDEAEAKQKKKDDKAQKKLSKKDKEKLKEEEDEVKFDDTKFSENIFNTLKNSGFVDTLNQIFQDQNNTLFLEGKITRLKFYSIGYSGNPYDDYFKSKVYLTWYFKDQYNEVLDSLNTSELSGDFVLRRYYSAYSRTTNTDDEDKQVNKMVGDAIDNSYLNLYNNSSFTSYLQAETSPAASTDPILHLNRPQSVVEDKSDASAASVIIKREDQGHGSGFAITQDGYILTNYHVIASKDPAKAEKLKVITASGDELETKVVRFNKSRDIALLKVDKTFDKAFVLSNNKDFKNLQDVYTIGAPKSIELGQTVTSGMISNERTSNNNDLIQLSMAVNFGNSGGPVFDNAGTLYGVIKSKLVGQSTEGISFAIPAYKINEYINVSY